VLERLAEGMTYKEIALERGVSVSTVRTFVYRAYARLGLTGRGGRGPAIVFMKDSGWLGAPTRERDPRSRTWPPRAAARGSRSGLTPVQAAYTDRFDALLRERSERAEAVVTVAAGLHGATHGYPKGRRGTLDIEEWLLRMALKMTHPSIEVSRMPIDAGQQATRRADE
jgi:hypothetical protein